jgi:DMSO/TMAO reductase YedYZ molybdopterin-dependent catalytic subunit
MMEDSILPPDQHEIKEILKWNIDHPGIVRNNPIIDLENWKLTVDGEVEKQIELSWKDFLKIPSIESRSDFHCVEGWSVPDCRWYGVKFTTLVDMVKPKKEAKYVFFKCLDGYTTSLDLIDLLQENVLLAYRLNGKPLEVSLGGPLRLVVPLKYAYKSAMWIEQISFAKAKELGFWEKRGYSDTAKVWENDRYSK